MIGTLAISDLLVSYRRALESGLRRASEMGGATGLLDVFVDDHAPIVGTTLHQSTPPRGLMITAIERAREIISVTGETTIRSGDRLMALGSSDDLNALSRIATTNAGDESVREDSGARRSSGYVAH